MEPESETKFFFGFTTLFAAHRGEISLMLVFFAVFFIPVKRGYPLAGALKNLEFGSDRVDLQHLVCTAGAGTVHSSASAGGMEELPRAGPSVSRLRAAAGGLRPLR